MKLSDGLKALRKAALDKVQKLLDDVRGSDAKDFTDAQAKEFDALEKDVQELDGKIERAERAEKMEASAKAVPATDPTGQQQARVPAAPKKELKADKKVAITLAAQLKGRYSDDGQKHPFQVLEDEGYGQFAMELAQVNGVTKSINTLTPSAGGILMPQPARGELLEIVYPETTFLQGGPQRIPMVGGAYEQPLGVTGATAAYVGEGGKKPVSDLTFDKMSMKSKKLAAIVTITKEARKWLVPDIVGYVERNMRIVLPTALNTAGYLGTGTGDSPLGILNKSGIGVYAASTTGYFADVKNPTIQELDRIATRMTTHMTTRRIGRNPRWAWVMSSRTIEYLRNFRIGTNLDLAFPELQGDAPRWKGIRVLEEVALPENLGGGTDETVLALVNFDDVLFGEEEGLNTSTSDQATIDVSGTLVHLWQQNMYALLAEMMHDFGLQRVASVVRLNNVRWGAP